MIQSTIARLASHSFAIKGIAVTVTSAVVAFVVDKSRPSVAALAMIAIGACWFVDAGYLFRERLFRSLHDQVRIEQGAADFSMNASAHIGGECTWVKSLCSWSQRLFYVPLLMILLLALAIGWKT